ncbi:MAG: ATP-binding protein [Fibromonadaceae bacterium]|jgi:predicted AAA+ superfamily ATPase|nr:ATP-binding protein [Fibromonadaceae bacterium]
MIKRTLQPFIKETSQSFPVLLLCGMRQAGKSTLLKEIKESGRRYISLDDVQTRNFAKNDPKLFLQTYPPPVIIDEAQYAPELFTEIKIYVDEHPKERGAFWLSGSQQFRLMKGIRETLAGRIAIIDLMGLSQKEIMQNAGKSIPFLPSFALLKQNKSQTSFTAKQIFDFILRGSFPALYAFPKTRTETFYKSYLQTYIERDARDDLGLKNELKYYDFIRAVAARTGNLLNYANLANDVDINVKTAKIWLDSLVRAGIVMLVEPYSANMNRRIVNTPKVYFLDTGLASYLTKWNSAETLMNGAMSGAMLETYVLCEILKSYRHNGLEENISFYRDSNGVEIDFIIEQNGILHPIEIKKTAAPDKHSCKKFYILKESKKEVGTGAVLCFYDSVVPIDNDVLSIPVWGI